MYILIDQKSNLSYVSKCLSPLCLMIGITTQTARNWLKQPNLALKRGYTLQPATLLKTRHKVNKCK